MTCSRIPNDRCIEARFILWWHDANVGIRSTHAFLYHLLAASASVGFAGTMPIDKLDRTLDAALDLPSFHVVPVVIGDDAVVHQFRPRRPMTMITSRRQNTSCN